MSEWAPDKIPMLRLKKMRASGRRQLTNFDEISELIKRKLTVTRVICLAFLSIATKGRRGDAKKTTVSDRNLESLQEIMEPFRLFSSNPGRGMLLCCLCQRGC